MSKSRWVRICSAFTLSTQLLTLARPAMAIEEAGKFNFSDTSVGAAAASDALTQSNGAKLRSSPIGSSGAYTTNVSFDVPPGRRGMTPSVGLSYSSSEANRDSAVGAGWALTAPRITRSTRLGMPRLVPSFAGYSYSPDTAFDSPSGELVVSSHGPPTAGRMFAAKREASPVRYEFLDDAAGGRWIEHLPNGSKRFYGLDPYSARTARINTELGTFAWLLLREEDPFGNDIHYSYHYIEDQDRAAKNLASRVPVLKKVEWGGHRPSGLAPAFALETDVSAQAGPLNALDGNTILSSRVDRVRISGVGVGLYWAYDLTYADSPDSRRLLLAQVARAAPGEATTSTTFEYARNPAGPVFGPLTALPTPLRDEFVERRAFGDRHPYDAEWNDLDKALGQHGFGSGFQFVNLDGVNGNDAVYLPAGLSGPQSLLSGNKSFLIEPGLPARRLVNSTSHFAQDTLLKSLADMDGDGDLDGVTFPLAYKVAGIEQPSDYLRAASPMAECLNPVFWQTCGHEEPYRPSRSNVGDTTCRGLLSGCLTPHYTEPQGATVGRQLIHVAINNNLAGSSIHNTSILEDWPTSAYQQAHIVRQFGQPGPAQATTVSYTGNTIRDFQAPIVDINGDGKPDVVLLKQRVHADPLSEAMEAQFKGRLFKAAERRGKSPDALLEFLAWFNHTYTRGEWNARKTEPGLVPILERLGLPSDQIDIFWTSVVVNDLFEPLFQEMSSLEDDEYVVAAQRFVDTYGNACPQRAAEYPPPRHLPLRGLPSPFAPGGDWGPGGPFGPLGGGPPFPNNPLEPWVPNRFGHDPSDWCGVMWGPRSMKEYLDDQVALRFGANGGVLPWNEDSRNVAKEVIKYVPRVYLAEDATARRFFHESQAEGRPGRFGASLAAMFNRGNKSECGGSACEYPPHRNFTSILLDVNGDGLADVVRATPPAPAGGGVRACVGGHRVEINKGYTWAAEDSVSPDIQFEAASGFAPLALLKNRDGRCIDIPDAGGGTIPISAMASVDINSDGRLDWVVAYERREPFLNPAVGSTTIQHVFLNTGRGYRHAPEVILPPDFVLSVFIQPGIMVGDPLRLPDAPPLWPDAGRFVDVDGDGLTDIVQMGFCRTTGVPPNVVEECPRKGSWRRNIGVTPDLLLVERSSRGAETRVDYARGNDPSFVVGRGVPRTVVKAITHLPRPYVNVPGLGLPAYSVTLFSYYNHVHDVESPDVIGFESVTASADNYVDGSLRSQITTTDTYDVREQPTAADGTPLPIRFPFRGAKATTTTASGSASVTTSFTRDAKPVGSGIRLEEVGTTTQTCESGVCADSQSAVLARDAEGFVTETISGKSDGVTVLPGRDTRRTVTTYEHRTDSRWQLGLALHQETRGMTEDLSGERWDEPLAVADTTYGSKGEVASESTPAAVVAGCASTGPAVTTYQTNDKGLVWRQTGPTGLVVSRTFDAKHLYAASTSSTVSRFVDGALQAGSTSLLVQAAHDLRTGQQVSYTEPNGHVWTNSFDSRGRPLAERVPGNATVRTFAYADGYPSKVEARTVTDADPNAYIQSIRYFDGDGNALAVIEGRGTADVPWVRKDFARYDGFGRRIEAYLPKFVGSTALETYDPSDPKAVTELDGFDRPISATRPDGGVTTYVYTPSTSTETNARGMRTVREFDEGGDIIRVAREDAVGTLVSEHHVYRDSLGVVVRVVDGDGNVRHLVHDNGGRLTRYDLPHAPGASAPTTLVCHDVAGQPSRVVTPAGRTVVTVRDQAGRIVSLTGTDAGGATARRTTDYDDPTPGKNGLGRVAATRDASGTTRHSYDTFTRPSQVVYSPSADLSAGLPNVAASYTTTFDYSPMGGLRSFQLTGLPQPVRVEYVKDVAGRTRALKSGTRALVSGVLFDAEERIIQTQLGNGTSSQRVYDPLSGLLREARSIASDGSLIEDIAYEYDATDNVTLETRNQGTTLVSQKTHSFDATDRLVASELWTQGHNRQETFAYSAGGNLLHAGQSAYTYGQANNAQAVTALQRDGSPERELSYGPDGEAVADSAVESGTGLMVARTLETDALGCLTRVTDSNRSTRLFCGSSGEVVGRRTTDTATGTVSARIDLAGIGELRPAEGIFLARIPLSGSTTVEEAYSLSNGALDTNKSAYVVADMRGSTLARLGYNAPGEVKSHESEYDAWGEAVAISALPRPTHAYTNQEPDPGTGYYHYGPRHYDPSLRRWLSPDPLIWLVPERQTAWGEQLNLYGYASNNPARWTDLTGMEPTLRSLFELVASAVTGAANGASPIPIPDPPLASDTTSKYAAEHRVGYALGQLAGGVASVTNGAKLETAAVGGEIGSFGSGTMVAVPAAALGSVMVISGTMSIGRAVTALYHEAVGSGSGGPTPPNQAGPAPSAAPAPAPSPGPTPPPTGQPAPAQSTGAGSGSKEFTPEQQALVEMAKKDKAAGGISPADMDAYKKLNAEAGKKGFVVPGAVRGPETHAPRTPNSPPGPGQQPHGHVGPVGHIPIK